MTVAKYVPNGSNGVTPVTASLVDILNPTTILADPTVSALRIGGFCLVAIFLFGGK